MRTFKFWIGIVAVYLALLLLGLILNHFLVLFLIIMPVIIPMELFDLIGIRLFTSQGPLSPTSPGWFVLIVFWLAATWLVARILDRLTLHHTLRMTLTIIGIIIVYVFIIFAIMLFSTMLGWGMTIALGFIITGLLAWALARLNARRA